MNKLDKETIRTLEEMGAPKEFIEIKESLETESVQWGFGGFDSLGEGFMFMATRFTNLKYTNSEEMFQFNSTFNLGNKSLTFTEEIVDDSSAKETEEYKELVDKIAELGFKFIELGKSYENTTTHGLIINYSEITVEKLEAVAELWFEYNEKKLEDELENSTNEEDFNDVDTGYTLSLDGLK